MKTHFFYIGKYALKFGFLNVIVINDYKSADPTIGHFGVQWDDLFGWFMGEVETRYFEPREVFHSAEVTLSGQKAMYDFRLTHNKKYNYYKRLHARFLYSLWYYLKNWDIPSEPCVWVDVKSATGEWVDATLTRYPFTAKSRDPDVIVGQAIGIREIVEAMRADIAGGFKSIISNVKNL